MPEVKMVVIGGVRFRPEDAPKKAVIATDFPEGAPDADSQADGATVQHKARTPRKTAARKVATTTE